MNRVQVPLPLGEGGAAASGLARRVEGRAEREPDRAKPQEKSNQILRPSVWEGVLDDQIIAWVRAKFVVRQSSVVLSELRRGARTSKARRLVEELRRLTKTQWTPVTEDWWRTGMIIQKIGDAQKWDHRKRQEFQNDALIAFSARRFGATIITANRTDFELLAEELRVLVGLTACTQASI